MGETFNPNIPVVTTLSGFVLEKNGFLKSGTTYTKDGVVVKYDGVHFTCEGKPVQFFEDIKKAPKKEA